jgi:peptidylprolyl isomerase
MPVQPGDTVRVHYIGTLADGTEFDSSQGREPLEFTAGQGQVIPGFDEAVMGMEPGQTQTVTLPADEAYGDRDEDRVIEVDRSMLPPDAVPTVGDQVVLGTEEGQRIPAWIVEVHDDTVVLDANHPLAGEELTFEITLESMGEKLDPKSPLGLPPEA